jgi:dTMP kinase
VPCLLKKGRFITFEGPDGSGKTTQLRLLARWLESPDSASGRVYTVLTTREPGGTPIGEAIRDLVHDCTRTEMTASAEILLYSASRAQLVRQVIRPALDRGAIVLCDRYFDSTYAYQGYGRGLSLAMLKTITTFAIRDAVGALIPDLTLYLDVPPEVGLARRQRGGGEMNRLDREALDFHQRVRNGYLTMAREDPDRWRVVDATAPIAEVQETLRGLVGDLLLNR